jgi:SnoaL-like polyketide cyclase
MVVGRTAALNQQPGTRPWHHLPGKRTHPVTPLLDTVETPDRVVIAFLMRGRHVGPFTSPLGTVAPTQRDIEVRTIDVLVVTEGLVSAIWVVSDDLGLLRQLDAAKLA